MGKKGKMGCSRRELMLVPVEVVYFLKAFPVMHNLEPQSTLLRQDETLLIHLGKLKHCLSTSKRI